MKQYIIALFSLLSLTTFAQNVSGTMTYIATAPNGQQDEWVMQFNATTSISYTDRSEKAERKMTEVNGAYRVTMTDPEGRTIYKDTKGKIILDRQMALPQYPSDIIINESMEDIDWEITGEEKKVGGFSCTLAKAQYKKRLFYAWFTYDVPVPHGLWKLYGLPGLILEAYDSDKRFYFGCKELKMPATDPAQIKAPTLGQPVTFAEYMQMCGDAEKIVYKKIVARAIAAGNTPPTSGPTLPNMTEIHIEGRLFTKSKD